MNTCDVKVSRPARLAAAVRSAVGPAGQADEGLSLLNIMAALLIAGLVIAAFAIPSFIGARRAAENVAAESNANSAVTDMKIVYTTDGSYPATAAFVDDLAADDPNMTWTTSASTGTRDVSVVAGSNGYSAIATTWSPAFGGVCYVVLDVESPHSSEIDTDIPRPGVWEGSVYSQSKYCVASRGAVAVVGNGMTEDGFSAKTVGSP